MKKPEILTPAEPPPTTIKVGQWVCLESVLLDRICDSPMRVARLTSTRVYLETKGGREIARAQTNVVFCCDTESQANQLFAISESQRLGLAQVRREHQKKINEMYASIRERNATARENTQLG